MILNLRWDDITYQYKVDQPGDQSGDYVPLKLAQELALALSDELRFLGAKESEASRKILDKVIKIGIIQEQE